MPYNRPVSELFAEIMAYAEATGASNINELPGCWESEVGDEMFIAVNGHSEPVTASRGPELPPLHAFIEVNGWPAAILSPFGGTAMFSSEDELIERFKAATESLKEPT